MDLDVYAGRNRLWRKTVDRAGLQLSPERVRSRYLAGGRRREENSCNSTSRSSTATSPFNSKTCQDPPDHQRPQTTTLRRNYVYEKTISAQPSSPTPANARPAPAGRVFDLESRAPSCG